MMPFLLNCELLPDKLLFVRVQSWCSLSLLTTATMAVSPFRIAVRRFGTSAARAAVSVSPQEMTSYHEKVSKAQGTVDSLTGGMSSVSSL